MTADLNATYFISDLHLDSDHPELTQAFHHFLFEIAIDAQAIYILGDFFDAWIGDDHHSPLIQTVQNWLKEKSSKGTALYFLHGNRDFLIGEKFAKNCNVILSQETEVIDLYGINFLILHGDQLCTEDVDYQRFRQKVRDPSWQKNVLSYPLWVRKLIAKYMRYKSRKAHQYKTEEIMDVSPATVEEYFSEHKVQNMIHGHTHRPATHGIQVDKTSCKRYVLGDWGKSGWYIKADQREVALIEFPIP